MFSMAPYNLKLQLPMAENPSANGVRDDFEDVQTRAVDPTSHSSENSERVALLVAKAFGCTEKNLANLEISYVASNKACAVVTFCSLSRTMILSFRGTKVRVYITMHWMTRNHGVVQDPVDVITDITFFPAVFEPELPALSLLWKQRRDDSRDIDENFDNSLSLDVHKGFWIAFDSLKDVLSKMLQKYRPARTLFTGHSMGGALAQLGAAYFAHTNPYLVTFGSPASGTLFIVISSSTWFI
jgi:hypothetical protein